MDVLPEHLRERIFEDYSKAVQGRCAGLVTGLDHCGLFETAQSCEKLRKRWLSLRLVMLEFTKEPATMRGLVQWMVKIDKRARAFARWLEEKRARYALHRQMIIDKERPTVTDPELFTRMSYMHIRDFALGQRTSRDMLKLLYRLPDNTKVRLFTQTQEGACVVFCKALRKLPQLLQTIDLRRFPSKRYLDTLSCTDAQFAVLEALRL